MRKKSADGDCAPQSWPDLVQEDFRLYETYLLEPNGEPLANVKQSSSSLVEKPVLFAIGPEGGFTPNEVELAEDAGATKVSLGQSILRIETAAVAVAAWQMIQRET